MRTVPCAACSRLRGRGLRVATLHGRRGAGGDDRGAPYAGYDVRAELFRVEGQHQRGHGRATATTLRGAGRCGAGRDRLERLHPSASRPRTPRAPARSWRGRDRALPPCRAGRGGGAAHRGGPPPARSRSIVVTGGDGLTGTAGDRTPPPRERRRPSHRRRTATGPCTPRRSPRSRPPCRCRPPDRASHR